MKRWPGSNGAKASKPIAQTRPQLPAVRDWQHPTTAVSDDRDLSYSDADPDDPLLHEPAYTDDGGADLGRRGLTDNGLPAVLPTVTWDDITWKARYQSRVLARHLIRIPLYLLRALRWAPIGVARAVRNLYQWDTDRMGRTMIGFARDEGNIDAYLRVKKDHERTAETRFKKFVVCGCVIVGAAAWGAVNHPWPTMAVFAGTFWLAAWYGAPRDQPIIEHLQPAGPEFRVWDPGVIQKAFEVAGLSKVPREGEEPEYGTQVTFVLTPAREGDQGTVVVLDLPLGKTASDVFRAKPKLASGLSVAKVQLLISPDEDSERRIELYIADRDPFRTEPVITPLAEVEKLDFWEPWPFGTDARGNDIDISMLWTHILIGSIPRQGKTYCARLIACAAALDPHVRLVVFNAKGDGSWSPFEQIAHRYGSGQRDDVVNGCIDALEEVWEDVKARNEKLTELRDEIPESKITKRLSRDPDLDMPLTVVVIDEFQLYMEDTRPVQGGSTPRGKRFMDLLVDIAKVAPSSGVMLVLATQRPDASSSKKLTSLRDNIGTRLCLKVMTADAAKMILGVVPPGKSPTQFLKAHKGVAVLMGGSDDDPEATEAGRIVRAHVADDETVKEITARSLDLRTKLGTLSGDAVGDRRSTGEDTAAVDLLLDHVLEVVRSGEDKLQLATVLDRLTVEHPDLYHGWAVDLLGSHLRSKGVDTSVQVNRTDPQTGKRTNLRGVVINDVKDALARQIDRAQRTRNGTHNLDTPGTQPRDTRVRAGGGSNGSNGNGSGHG